MYSRCRSKAVLPAPFCISVLAFLHVEHVKILNTNCKRLRAASAAGPAHRKGGKWASKKGEEGVPRKGPRGRRGGPRGGCQGGGTGEGLG